MKGLFAVLLSCSFAFIVKDDCNDEDKICMECAWDRIHGFIRRDAVNADAVGELPITSMLTTAHFNGVKASSCKSGFGYDQENDGFYFEVELGQCNMETMAFTSDDDIRYIKFTQSINFGEQNMEFAGINFFFGRYGAYEFNCNYRQSLRTAKESFTPLIKEIPTSDRVLDQFVSWDSTFELKFFEKTFNSPMDPETFYLGSQMYFMAIWTEKFTEEFPVVFHLSECTIRDRTSDMSFDVIKEGCAATILWTTLLSETAYQKEKVKWSYRSFQFAKDQTAADMTLDCEVKFCLDKDRIDGKCIPYPDTCPDGYIQPKFK